MKRIDYLDGWRGLAIFTVIFGHFITSRLFDTGVLGVELFFVLSGRLMAEILFAEEVDLRTFYVRRVARIYPAMLLFASCCFLLGGYLDLPVTLSAYLAALSLTYNYWQIFFGQVPVLDHIWSLCIEEHVYILLGLTAFAARKLKINALPVIAALALAFMANGIILTLAGGAYEHVYWRSDVHGASILLAAALYLASRMPAFASYFTLKYGTVAGLAAALALYATNDLLRYSLGTAMLAYAICALPADVTAFRRVLSSKPAIALGIVSYSIYLWQQPAYKLGHHASDRLPLLAPCILLALASYFLVESPARRYINALWGRRKLQPQSS